MFSDLGVSRLILIPGSGVPGNGQGEGEVKRSCVIMRSMLVAAVSSSWRRWCSAPVMFTLWTVAASWWLVLEASNSLIVGIDGRYKGGDMSFSTPMGVGAAFTSGSSSVNIAGGESEDGFPTVTVAEASGILIKVPCSCWSLGIVMKFIVAG